MKSFHVGDASLLQTLSRNPGRNQSSGIGTRHRVLNSHKRMPQYMIQLYKELTTGNDGGIVKRKMPYSANAIRGLDSGKHLC